MAYKFNLRCNPFRRQNSKVPERILAIVLTLLVTGSVVFGIGMVHYGNTGHDPPQNLKDDPTFYSLLSQSLVHILTSSCILATVMKDGPRAGFKTQPNVCVIALLAMILAISVPATYAGTDEVRNRVHRSKLWWSTSSRAFAPFWQQLSWPTLALETGHEETEVERRQKWRWFNRKEGKINYL